VKESKPRPYSSLTFRPLRIIGTMVNLYSKKPLLAFADAYFRSLVVLPWHLLASADYFDLTIFHILTFVCST
jgi:hypothetical protein